MVVWVFIHLSCLFCICTNGLSLEGWAVSVRCITQAKRRQHTQKLWSQEGNQEKWDSDIKREHWHFKFWEQGSWQKQETREIICCILHFTSEMAEGGAMDKIKGEWKVPGPKRDPCVNPWVTKMICSFVFPSFALGRRSVGMWDSERAGVEKSALLGDCLPWPWTGHGEGERSLPAKDKGWQSITSAESPRWKWRLNGKSRPVSSAGKASLRRGERKWTKKGVKHVED